MANRRQVIILTNNGLAHSHIHASPGHYEWQQTLQFLNLADNVHVATWNIEYDTLYVIMYDLLKLFLDKKQVKYTSFYPSKNTLLLLHQAPRAKHQE